MLLIWLNSVTRNRISFMPLILQCLDTGTLIWLKAVDIITIKIQVISIVYLHVNLLFFNNEEFKGVKKSVFELRSVVTSIKEPLSSPEYLKEQWMAEKNKNNAGVGEQSRWASVILQHGARCIESRKALTTLGWRWQHRVGNGDWNLPLAIFL